MALTVLICDDHRLFADALALALTKHDIEVAAVTNSAAEALTMLASCTPDVCLIDRNLPDADGIELARVIRAAKPNSRVLVVSGSRRPDLVRQALEAGAAGFVSKEVGVEHLARALRRVHAGKTVDEPGLAGHRRETEASELARLLTCREQAVLERLVQGSETSAIATDLGISYTTARTYIQNLLRKLGVHSKLELVALAVEQRLVRPPGQAPQPTPGAEAPNGPR